MSAAEDGTSPERWYRLNVFDDGWVDFPGLARGIYDARSNLKSSLWMLLGLVGGIVVVVLLVLLGSSVGGGLGAAIVVIAVVLFFGGAITMQVLQFRTRRRNWVQSRDDAEQSRELRAAGQNPRRRPGVKLFTRVTSAQQYADAITNVRLTRAVDVAGVSCSTVGAGTVAQVQLQDGGT
ncbi:MAG: hypothetical protein M3Y77_12670, partial [Actinomycetota bacterium]|nr:hypothetical protein [Actinomycetota bacterium]